MAILIIVWEGSRLLRTKQSAPGGKVLFWFLTSGRRNQRRNEGKTKKSSMEYDKFLTGGGQKLALFMNGRKGQKIFLRAKEAGRIVGKKTVEETERKPPITSRQVISRKRKDIPGTNPRLQEKEVSLEMAGEGFGEVRCGESLFW